MADELFSYFERELQYLGQMCELYAREHPKEAARLKLVPDQSEDPHVGRLIESFALLSARIHHKLDEQFPEITASILETLYPHYLRPVPSMAIAQLRKAPDQSSAPGGIDIPAGSRLSSQPGHDGSVAWFRSCFPVTLLPLEITGASLLSANSLGATLPPGTAYAVTLTLETTAGAIGDLQLSSLRVHLNGRGAYVYNLYEWLFNQATGVMIRSADSPGTRASILPAESIRPVGFAEGEAMLPYPDRSFPGYRLVQEYFHFPRKFLFFDLASLDVPAMHTVAGKSVEVAILLRDPPSEEVERVRQGMSAETFQLGCTPIVNLFQRAAEPIRLTHTEFEYRVVPDQHRQSTTEVHSVTGVRSLNPANEQTRVFAPFYALRYPAQAEAMKCFWVAKRRPSRHQSTGTEVYLSFVDLQFNPADPQVDRVTPLVTCTNRDLCDRLEWRGRYGELEIEGHTNVGCRLLGRPSKPSAPPLGGSHQWRLVSHLSLNYLSIVDGGTEALQSILRLYDLTGKPEISEQINGIARVTSEAGLSRAESPTGVAFCRGTDVTIDFDDDKFGGAGVFLFAAVLERFIGLYVGINSWSRLHARTTRGTLKRWPARTGEQILL